MVVQDVEACKKFLMEKNNAGELNIEKLCVVGAEMGAVLAMTWAITDWSWPRLATGKQGQDVKAVVLLSPIFQVPKSKLNLATALNSPLQSNLSVSIIYGGTKAKPPYPGDAKRAESQLARFHTDLDEQTLFVDAVETSLQGTKMLTEPALNVHILIAEFIKVRLVGKDYPWKERLGP
jgi:alpha-beta hydrolase superfamily lysophospholipase